MEVIGEAREVDTLGPRVDEVSQPCWRRRYRVQHVGSLDRRVGRDDDVDGDTANTPAGNTEETQGCKKGSLLNKRGRRERWTRVQPC